MSVEDILRVGDWLLFLLDFPLTLVDWFQLGEFRRFSPTEISDKGRGMLLLLGVVVGVPVPLEMRNGCVI